MKNEYPWIYTDSSNNTWKYYLNQNRELVYKIMYNEGKWTKEKIICKSVNDFYVYVDVYEKVHIVYSNLKGKLGYCTINAGKWMGKILYSTKSDDIIISDLKVEIIGENMHIFYLLCEDNGRDHGTLIHCIWNGKETKFNDLYDIILPKVSDKYYEIKVGITGSIDLFFVTDAGDEVSLNYLSYENNFWTSPIRLYGLKGENISFKVLMTDAGIHILNKLKENSIYTLEHVWIDFDNKIKNYKVFESQDEIVEPIIFYRGNNIYVCFIQENKIRCSVYDNNKWCKPVDIHISSELNLQVYNYISKDSTDGLYQSVQIYGTGEPDSYFYNFDYLIKRIFDLMPELKNKNTPHVSKENIKKIKERISKMSSTNKVFEKKINLLQVQLQKKQGFIEEYEKKLNRAFEQKSKADENCNILTEVKGKVENQLKGIKKQLEEEQGNNEELQDQNESLIKENSALKIQIEKLNHENEEIKKQLELERNESIFAHFLRKKSDDI
ncbi:hypothetical protein [Clostridium sp. JN-1]|uniref:hypothetical protein n=1 Tax=Clostridium sp. JN-1 TaxID=2483110 RepID=UPI000F0B2803|nr:hypothetical protein [Clostridium sp. JN-1]